MKRRLQAMRSSHADTDSTRLQQWAQASGAIDEMARLLHASLPARTPLNPVSADAKKRLAHRTVGANPHRWAARLQTRDRHSHAAQASGVARR